LEQHRNIELQPRIVRHYLFCLLVIFLRSIIISLPQIDISPLDIPIHPEGVYFNCAGKLLLGGKQVRLLIEIRVVIRRNRQLAQDILTPLQSHITPKKDDRMPPHSTHQHRADQPDQRKVTRQRMVAKFSGTGFLRCLAGGIVTPCAPVGNSHTQPQQGRRGDKPAIHTEQILHPHTGYPHDKIEGWVTPKGRMF